MIEVRRTQEFAEWLRRLDRRDPIAAARIATRITRIGLGAFGDTKVVAPGIEEARLFFGPGYRLYFSRFGSAVVILLCGGDKSTQASDIARAGELVKRLE